MPHLQLDVSNRYPVAVKRTLAKRFGEVYAEIMQTTPDLVGVSFRELGDGGHWRYTYDEPVPAAVLSCEIRRGRPPERRARLGRPLVDACVESLDLDPLLLTVELTQHAGDEIYGTQMVDGVLRGGLAKDWSPDETKTPLMESLAAAAREARKGAT